jgi:hypothetical protein
MKSLRIITVITGIFVAACVGSAVAQNKAEKTSSARAYYGQKPEKSIFKKKKKQKADWHVHSKPAKGTRADAWSTRRKFS